MGFSSCQLDEMRNSGNMLTQLLCGILPLCVAWFLPLPGKQIFSSKIFQLRCSRSNLRSLDTRRSHWSSQNCGVPFWGLFVCFAFVCLFSPVYLHLQLFCHKLRSFFRWKLPLALGMMPATWSATFCIPSLLLVMERWPTAAEMGFPWQDGLCHELYKV